MERNRVIEEMAGWGYRSGVPQVYHWRGEIVIGGRMCSAANQPHMYFQHDGYEKDNRSTGALRGIVWRW